MKKRMNKQLALLLAVLMLFSSIGINAVAANNHECQTSIGNPKYSKEISPTCDEEGYTENYCVHCGKLVSKSDYKEAIGHKYEKVGYDPADGKAYNKYRECTRYYTENGQTVSTCGSREYEEDDNGRTRYYKVTFVNNKTTDTYYEDIPYTSVAKTYKDETLYTCYVKKGDEIAYEGNDVPYREKTLYYGKYDYIGWTTDSELDATVSENLSGDDCVDLINLSDNLNQADLVLYPVFMGVNVAHEVIFYGTNGEKLTNSQFINHGETPLFSNPEGNLYKAPTKDEDIKNYYKFAGWTAHKNQLTGIPNNEIESKPVYGDIFYHPTFEPVAKNYVVEFYDETGKTLLKLDDESYAVFEGVNLDADFNTTENEAYKQLLDFSLKAVEKKSDKEYRYTWAGWQILCADDSLGSKIVDVNSKNGKVTFKGFSNIGSSDFFIDVDEEGNIIYLDGTLEDGLVTDTKPNKDPNKEPRKVIRLVPVFYRQLEYYAVDVKMQLPAGEDPDYYLGQADVHIVDRNGQLKESGLTNADGVQRFYIPYVVPYTVTVATYDGKYIGTATISDLEKRATFEDDEAEANKCLVEMKLNPEYETHCSCIHHNALLQPIVVRLFNILYSFFNVKYVCCYDMYSTIGPLLAYTA